MAHRRLWMHLAVVVIGAALAVACKRGPNCGAGTREENGTCVVDRASKTGTSASAGATPSSATAPSAPAPAAEASDQELASAIEEYLGGLSRSNGFGPVLFTRFLSVSGVSIEDRLPKEKEMVVLAKFTFVPRERIVRRSVVLTPFHDLVPDQEYSAGASYSASAKFLFEKFTKGWRITKVVSDE